LVANAVIRLPSTGGPGGSLRRPDPLRSPPRAPDPAQRLDPLQDQPLQLLGVT